MSKTKEAREGWHLLAGAYKEAVHLWGWNAFFFFLTSRTDILLCFHWWDFRKSLNVLVSHSDLWRLIALISLKLTARTKLDSQAALCAHCSWQILIRATLFSAPLHPASVIIPATSPRPHPTLLPPPFPLGAGALRWQFACRQAIGEERWRKSRRREKRGQKVRELKGLGGVNIVWLL